MTEIVNNKGQVTMDSIAKSALRDTEKLNDSDILKSIIGYLAQFKNEIPKYIVLNSKEINYIQVFSQESKTKKEIGNHILDFMKESSFAYSTAVGGVAVSIPLSDVELIQMDDVRDYDVKEDGLELYIGTVFFKIYACDWVVEEVI